MKKEILVCKIEEYLNKSFFIETKNKTSVITNNSIPKIKTKRDLTDLMFVLDYSGSMSCFESDTI